MSASPELDRLRAALAKAVVEIIRLEAICRGAVSVVLRISDEMSRLHDEIDRLKKASYSHDNTGNLGGKEINECG